VSRTKVFLAALVFSLQLTAPAWAVCPVTWNPADKSASVTLSGANLTASQASAGASVRANTSITASAKVFFSETIGTANGNQAIGIANATMSLSSFPGLDFNGVGYTQDGRVMINSNSLLGMPTYTTADVIDVALDIGNLSVWFRKNGGNWNNSGTANPATNTGGVSLSSLNAGPYFPSWGANTSNSATANFGASTLPYAAPAGFLTPQRLAGCGRGLNFMGPF
jgi:hypothetical protein